MKLSANRSELLKAVQTVFPAVGSKSNLPILSNVLINATSDALKITATDLELELTVTAPISAEEPGAITLPARRLYDILKAFPDEALVSISTGEGKATVKSGRSRFALQTLEADDYPGSAQLELETEITVSQAILGKAMAEASYAMAQKDVRYYLNGCLFDFDTQKNQVTVVSTDGHRLACKTVNATVQSSEPAGQVIVPLKGMMSIMKLIHADSDTPVTLLLGKNRLRIVAGDTCLTSILIDGKFPEYQRVIPKEFKSTVIADRIQLSELFKRVRLVLSDKTEGVRITLEDWLLKAYGRNSEQEEAEEELDVNYTGDPLEIGFNAGYLVDALNAISGETVKLGLTDAQSSLRLEAGDGESGIHVVMPMRL